MKNFNKKTCSAGQSTSSVAKSQKHDVNLQKNSTLYFQIGLILCLLGVYGLFEMEFETKIPKYEKAMVKEKAPDEFVMQEFKVYQEPVQQREEKPKVETRLITEPPKIEDNMSKDLPVQILTTSEQNVGDEVVDAKSLNVYKVVDDIPLPFEFIESVPVYPGCEKAKGNDARKKCMSEKIAKLVNRKFSPDIARDLGLNGIQKIYVEFKVGKTGKVKDIRARAPRMELENEAKRVINKIPVMTPGMQRNKPVDVIYSLPIIFQVKN
ncbi:energy transducer TonB [Mangrovimonas sp. TPBH4]|uniref:energy transducer TonB n=1 Tax=Mangrovimonas sp. TPBH4 TaxID=1645914 RepID=UPI0006B4430C|nr:energy transducer TonB [Mangrovimonas sp. TPBH4]